MINTYYTALGIHETATQDEIKSAYRKKVLECHPDRNNGSAESQKLFVAVIALPSGIITAGYLNEIKKMKD